MAPRTRRQFLQRSHHLLHVSCRLSHARDRIAMLDVHGDVEAPVEEGAKDFGVRHLTGAHRALAFLVGVVDAVLDVAVDDAVGVAFDDLQRVAAHDVVIGGIVVQPEVRVIDLSISRSTRSSVCTKHGGSASSAKRMPRSADRSQTARVISAHASHVSA